MLMIIENYTQFGQYIENVFKSICVMIDYCNSKTFFKNKVLHRKETK